MPATSADMTTERIVIDACWHETQKPRPAARLSNAMLQPAPFLAEEPRAVKKKILWQPGLLPFAGNRPKGHQPFHAG